MSTDTPAQQWEHLKQYGYAPGTYMNKCHKCQQVVCDLDKRAITCRVCAEVLAASPQPTAAQPLKDEQAVAELVEALRKIERMVLIDPPHAGTFAEVANEARAALSRAPGAGMLNVRGKPEPTA